jgi:N6-L-threonylcarbamoyladenine synthase
VRLVLGTLRNTAWKPTAFVMAGGVGANRTIRGALDAVCSAAGTPLVMPPPELCTDNGAMIAWTGIERLSRGLVDGMDTSPRARWPLSETAAA